MAQFFSPIEEAEDIFALEERFFQMGWTDGLPVVPPTPERVAAFLDYMQLQPTDIIATIPERNRVITAEKVAINCVMAGCLPEYMPVVVAALRAMAEPEYRFHASITSTGGAAPLLIVNGPIRQALCMNSGVNVFGPGNRANATIGRALRLVLINVAGARPGDLDKSTQGHPGKYTFCIAEAEEISPWEPLHVEHGFPPEASTVTVFAAESPHNIQNHIARDPQVLLECIAREMASIGSFSIGQSVLVLCPEHARIIAQSGWSKQRIKEFLYEHATQPVAELRRLGKVDHHFEQIAEMMLTYEGDEAALRERLKRVGVRYQDALRIKQIAEDLRAGRTDVMHRGLFPEDILIVVAGGEAGGHSAFIPSWSRTRASLWQMKRIVW